MRHYDRRLFPFVLDGRLVLYRLQRLAAHVGRVVGVDGDYAHDEGAAFGVVLGAFEFGCLTQVGADYYPSHVERPSVEPERSRLLPFPVALRNHRERGVGDRRAAAFSICTVPVAVSVIVVGFVSGFAAAAAHTARRSYRSARTDVLQESSASHVREFTPCFQSLCVS